MNQNLPVAPLWIFVFTLFLSSVSLAQRPEVKLKKQEINENVTVSVPEGFTLMDEAMYTRKYGAYRPPLAMYTDPNGYADFGVNVAVNRSLQAFARADWQEEDLTMLKGIYKGSIAGMHTEVEFLTDKIVEVNGRKFAALEFVGKVKDEEKIIAMNDGTRRQYSYLMYTILNKQVVIFNFTCPNQIISTWQPVAQEMMANLKVKD